MNSILKDIIIGRYKTMPKFWKEYKLLTGNKLSQSYIWKINSGDREFPDEMLYFIYYQMLKIDSLEIMDIISRMYLLKRKFGNSVTK